jgi:aldose 1-epimerase
MNLWKHTKTLPCKTQIPDMAYEILVDDSLNYSVVTLRNTETKHEVDVYSFGAILNAFRFPFEHSVINIVAAFTSPTEARQSITPFFRSAKLSPFVCRVKNGKYHYRDKNYKIEKFYLGEHALHALVFDAVFGIKETRTDQESAAVVLHHHYDGSDNGYPWEFDLDVEYKLSEGNMLSVRSTVQHSNEFAIPYADGWHPYFSLDTTIDECYLQFDSNTMMEFDERLIPTGKMLEEDRFRNKAYMKDVFLDNCFVLDQSLSQPKAVLSSEKLKLTILPEASYPYFQVYTPDDRRSIALECISGAPDCFNNGLGLTMIQPNETVSFTTHYIPSIIK